MDTSKRANYKKSSRKSLEANWFRAADEKYEREIEAKIGIPERITVQEQLDHYRYCLLVKSLQLFRSTLQKLTFCTI